MKKNGKQCGDCNRNTLLPYGYEFTCISCGFNLIKRKQELSKIQRKKIGYINRLKYAEQNIFCICVDVYRIYEGNNYNEKYEVLSKLKNKKLKIIKIIIGKYQDMLEKPDIEQDHYSRTATGIYKIGRDSLRLMKWLA